MCYLVVRCSFALVAKLLLRSPSVFLSLAGSSRGCVLGWLVYFTPLIVFLKAGEIFKKVVSCLVWISSLSVSLGEPQIGDAVLTACCNDKVL